MFTLILGFGSMLLGMLGLFFTVLRVIGSLRAEMRGEFGGLRHEMQGEIGTLRGEIGTLRGEIGTLRHEMQGEIGTLRHEMQGEIGTLRGEIGTLRHELRTEMQAGFARLDGNDQDLRRRVDRITDSLALRGLMLQEAEGT